MKDEVRTLYGEGKIVNANRTYANTNWSALYDVLCPGSRKYRLFSVI